MAARLQRPDDNKLPGSSFVLARIVALRMVFIFSQVLQLLAGEEATPIAYSKLKAHIAEGDVASVEMTGDRIIAVVNMATGDVRLLTYAPAVGDSALLPLLEEQDVTVFNKPEPNPGRFSWLLP